MGEMIVFTTSKKKIKAIRAVEHPNPRIHEKLNCKGDVVYSKEPFTIRDKFLGKYIVNPITEYQVCKSCGGMMFDQVNINQIEQTKDLVIHGKLGLYPIKCFVSAASAASILGIAPKELKTDQYKQLIYNTSLNGSNVVLYLQKSIERFNKTGDGRMRLSGRQVK